MADNKEIVLDVKINAQEVGKNLSEAIARVAELKERQKELRAEIVKGNDANGEYARELASVTGQLEANNRIVKSNTALLQAETLARLDDNASLDDQRQALNAAQKAYASLSGEELKAANASGGLREQIAKLSDRVKEQEAAIGDARRNVGNYANITAEAAGKMGSLGNGLQSVVNPVKNVTMGFKAMAATPLLATISILITIFQKLHDRFQGNQAAMEKLTPLFGAFAGAGNLVNKVIDKIAEGLGWIAEKALSLAKKLGVLKGSILEGSEIAKEDLAIQKEQQRVALANAESQNKIAKLRAQAAEKDKYTAKQRLALLQQASDEEEAISKRSYDLAKREYDLQVKKNAQSNSSQEDLKKENDLKIAMVNAETALFEKRKELNTKMATIRAQEAADAAARAKEAEELAKKEQEEAERRQKEQEAEAAEAEKAEKKKLEARKKAREQFGLEEGKSPEEQELELLQQAREQDLLNDEEYEIAKTLITEKYSKEREEKIAEEVARATELYQNEMKSAGSAAAGAMSALGDLVGAFAEDSEEAANAQKAFAFGSILINQAMAIAEGAKGIAAAMAGAAEAAAATGPAAPIMLGVYQAQMVGQVLALVASVASSIVQAKQIFSQAESQKFATGGIVGGTSYTGDRVPARLNSGEMVLNRESQTRLFDALSGGNGQELGINYEMMAAAMANTPAPRLVLRELQQFEDKVTTFDEIASV